MTRPSLHMCAVLALVLLYAALSLWPYDWQAVKWVPNAAERLPEGGLRFAAPGVALTASSPAWIETAMRFDRVEVSLRVRSLAPEQSGPARILTLAPGPDAGNLMIGQDGADLVVRLRTPETDRFGEIDGQPVAHVPDLFRRSAWLDLHLLVVPGRLRIAVGGATVVDRALPPRPLAGWDPSYRLALGNEVTYNRPWLGEIRRAVVRVADNIEDDVVASELEQPRAFLWAAKLPKLVPFRSLNVPDAIRNVLFYIPLGLLLGARSQGRRAIVLSLLCVAAVSASMELLQWFVPHRWPSVDDLIFNTFGGGLGLLLALGAGRQSSQ